MNTLSLTSFKCMVLTLELLKGKCWANVSQIFTFILIIKCLFIHIPTNILSIFCHSNGCSLVFEGIFPTFLVKLRDSAVYIGQLYIVCELFITLHSFYFLMVCLFYLETFYIFWVLNFCCYSILSQPVTFLFLLFTF